MIYFGIDDTDTLETAGTNQLAKEIVRRLAPLAECVSIVRHQLFLDPRVPYTSKNGSASIRVLPRAGARMPQLLDIVRQTMQQWYIEGSDPGLAACEEVPQAIVDYSRRCKSEVIEKREARRLAAHHGVHLEGLGGTDGGMIGALAALGLIANQDDGRVVQWGKWPDDLSGSTRVQTIYKRSILVRQISGGFIEQGTVDVGKHLRPNLVAGNCVLSVRPHDDPSVADWQAIKLL